MRDLQIYYDNLLPEEPPPRLVAEFACKNCGTRWESELNEHDDSAICGYCDHETWPHTIEIES